MFNAIVMEVQELSGLARVLIGLLIVAGIFRLALSTLSSLKVLGGKLTAEVSGQTRTAKNSLKINAKGLGGYFLALVATALGAIYIVVSVLGR